MPAALYLCLHLRDFAAQAMACAQPEILRGQLAILSGTPPLEEVFGLNQQARELGVESGMGRLQAESFAGSPASLQLACGGGGTAIRSRDRAQEERAFANVVGCAERFSP